MDFDVKISKMDWSRITFVAKEGTWFLGGSKVECAIICGSPNVGKTVEENWGIFRGAMAGEGNRIAEETCPLHEFDVLLDDVCVNKITYLDLLGLI